LFRFARLRPLSRRKQNPIPGDTVPKAVVSRLSLYLRELQRFVRGGGTTINSSQLGEILGITAAQVRKDFACFGQFGYPGIGYRCEELIAVIRGILGTDRIWPVALVGCGNLGQALLGYRGFGRQGFSVVLAFDSNPTMVGRTIGGLTIRDLSNLADDLAEYSVRMAILAVPASAAQQVVTQLVDAGITGILNFAPVTLSVPDMVTVAEVDLAIELEQLSFAVVKQLEKP
jgi:redox-sensing transcriptional repressor